MGKTVLDTNIYISAIRWGGNPGRILTLAFQGRITVILSLQQLRELRRVFEYEQFQFTPMQQERFLRNITGMAVLISTPGTLDVIQEDPSDNVILEAATVGEATHIVTGDSHLLKLKSYQGIRIMTPAKFLEELKN